MVVIVQSAWTYEEGKIGYCFIENIQDSMTLLCDYHDKGSFQVRIKELRKNRNLCDHFEKLIDSYRNNHNNYLALTPNSTEARISGIRLFLWSLEKLSVTDVEVFNNSSVSEAVTILSKEQKCLPNGAERKRTDSAKIYSLRGWHDFRNGGDFMATRAERTLEKHGKKVVSIKDKIKEYEKMLRYEEEKEQTAKDFALAELVRKTNISYSDLKNLISTINSAETVPENSCEPPAEVISIADTEPVAELETAINFNSRNKKEKFNEEEID
jgi:hypothetical protein